MAKKSFYEIGPSEGYLREGSYLEVRRQINYRGDRADFKPFLNVPIKDLEKQLKESQAEEKKVFEEMKKAVTAWDEHGAQTLLLQKAISKSFMFREANVVEWDVTTTCILSAQESCSRL